ncbi:MAG: xanthine dehydrogenase family protein subunit M [Burkholderiaceae bacterium]|nr:xanthine dehydrogenase family protein subunit M [Burkholderiaceae bacterium]
MKAPVFDYVRVDSVDKAIGLLQAHGDDARILAGGQTMMATLNMRLSSPQLLVDISQIDQLRKISVNGSTLHIGAMVTHSEIERSDVIRQHAPLLSMAVPHIAHKAIRNRGTWGGSLAYADPAAEWPACAIALGATLVAQGPKGVRRISADQFFLDLYTTALAADELLIDVEIPIGSRQQVVAFQELARRHGDYAIAGIAACAQRDGEMLRQPRFVFFAVANTPFQATRAQAVVDGKVLTPGLVDEAISALRGELNPLSDLTNTSATKLHLSTVLLKRAIHALSAGH